MKQLLFFLFILIGCSNPKPKTEVFNYFNEKDYELMVVRKDSSGMVYYEKFVHKNDTSRTLVKGYWENGSIQSSLFLFNKKKNGPARRYDTSGSIEAEYLFIRDKQSGLSVYYENGRIVNYAMHYDGRDLKIDNELKNLMLYQPPE